MIPENINTGTPNQKDGDKLRDAFNKVVTIFTDIYSKLFTNTSQLINDGANGTDPFITLNEIPDVPEYTLSPISGTNQVSLLKDGISISQIDLSPYLDDTNLARIIEGDLNPDTKILTVTRDDNSTFTIDLSSLSSSQPSNTIKVYEKSQIINQDLDSTKVYKLEASLELIEGEVIRVGSSLTIKGDGFNVTTLSTIANDGVIFESTLGGSGDIILQDMQISAFGTNSKVFDLKDSDGNHAIEMEYINFVGCKSLGKIDGYRQGTGTTLGIYGCEDGLQLSGSWNGFKFSNSNLFGFSSTGTFIKKDIDTSFSNRLFINLNFDVPIGSKITDLDSSNFEENELLQLNSCIAKVNGIISIDNSESLIPNISANNEKSLWIGNIGLPDTAIEILVEDNSVSGTYIIDWLKDTFKVEMTSDTVFTEKNLPASGKNTQEIKLYLSGDFTPTFPVGWEDNLVGNYNGDEVNEITIKYIKNGEYFVTINNSFSIYPEPFLYSINPAGMLPNTQTTITLKGDFYTPPTKVLIQGQTVNGITFVDSQTLEVVVSSGLVDGDYNITIINGQKVVFEDVLTISNGTVIIPLESEFVVVDDMEVQDNNVLSTSSTSDGYATWEGESVTSGQQFTLQCVPDRSPFLNDNQFADIELRSVSSGGRTGFFRVDISSSNPSRYSVLVYDGGGSLKFSANGNFDFNVHTMGIRLTGTKIQILKNGSVVNETDKFSFGASYFRFTNNFSELDYKNIKLIRQ